MKATNLRQAIDFFHQRPLAGEELKKWYVPRPSSPRGSLRILLETGDKPRKILFAGPRRCGITTELRRLTADLEAKFHPVFVDGPKFWSDLPKGIVASIKEEGPGDPLADSLSPLELDPDKLIRRIEERVRRRVLIVVDGLNTIGPHATAEVVKEYTSALSALPASTIGTFPALTEITPSFREGLDDFVVLPNARTHLPNGRTDGKGREWLKQLVFARLQKRLIKPSAMELLVDMSGGGPTWLFVLVVGAARHALDRRSEEITRADTANAARDLRRYFLGQLSDRDLNLLQNRQKIWRVGSPSEIARLLDNGSLIVYHDHQRWYDAHPVLWPLWEYGLESSAVGSEIREGPVQAPVYVKSLTLQSVKGIHQAKLDFSDVVGNGPGWYVLAGGNGSGKTTLLRSLALALLGRPASRIIDGSWVERGAEEAAIAIEFLADSMPETELRQRITILADGTLEVHSSDGMEELINDSSYYFTGYGPFKRLEGGSDHARDLARSDHQIGRVITLFLEEASLWEVPKWLFRIGEAGNHLEYSLTAFVNSGLLPGGYRAKGIDDEDLMIEVPDGPVLPLRMTSDGPRCMVAMILDILRSLRECHGKLLLMDDRVFNPGIVVIDEPDNHLHISWQLYLGSWMKKHFPKIQFIVATHSPFLCAAADKIWRLDDEEGRIAPRALPEEELRQIKHGSITAVLESDVFRIFSTLPPELRDRHAEFLRLRKLSLQGRRMSQKDQARLDELEQEFLGPTIPPDPEFDQLFPDT